MFGYLERWVAFRYLRAKRSEGFISVIALFSLLGIGLGVATLIIVMSVMNGFRAELLGRIIGLNGHIVVTAYQSGIDGFDRKLAPIKNLDHVVAAIPFIEGQVMAAHNQQAAGAIVKGITEVDLLAKSTLSGNIVQGSIRGFDHSEGVMIGLRMANRLGVTLGDNLTLIAPQGTATAFGTVPRLKSYPIVAIFNVGMYEYDSSYIYMPLQDAQIYFRLPEKVTGFEITLDNAQIAANFADLIHQQHLPGYAVFDWQKTNAGFFNALQVERNVMFLILTLIILVAAFNIISSQIMLVRDKARGIAILRTMGASRGTILRIFFMTGSSVGIIGTIAGSLLGIGFASNIEAIRQFLEGLSGTELFAAEIYFLSQLPAKIDPLEVGLVMGLALSLSFIASLYPAWRAAKLDPVEVLRYE